MVAAYGYCDGIKGDDLYGWAWTPDAPNDPVTIEVLIDGVPTFETEASVYRPDLRAAGVGHGRYGWRMPLVRDADRIAPLQFLARIKGGDPLIGGAFTLDVEIPPADRDNAEYAAFVATVAGDGAAFRRPAPPPPEPPTFLIYCPVSLGSETMGAAEYSYGFVMRAFLPVLEALGRCVAVATAEEAERVMAERLPAGGSVTLFSFAPPQRTPTGLRCPTIPVIAWEFPTIPIAPWGGEPRHDWRFVLRQCGRAITLSTFAADAIRAAMGAEFPVAAIPTPSWDRFPALHDAAPPAATTMVAIDGFVFDTRGRAFSAQMPIPPLPQPGECPTSVTLDGIVFTSVFSPRDGRKNWQDIVTALLTVHAERPDATLVFKMVGPDPGVWWWELYDVLKGMRPFACRLVVLQGYLEDDGYNDLIRATHWVVNASHAEGLCMPLLEYMSAGRPAVAPAHTAMRDYVSPANAIVVASAEENCGFPHDPANELTTTRHRIAWSSLADGLDAAYRLTRDDPAGYAALAADARATMRRFCSDETVAAKLDGFLGLALGRAMLPAPPSAAMRAAAA